ncbi:hypothetical protein [Rhizobium sp. BE258]|uniref:hypothetical protein n=1 Tax=Rhizobium sp. BE258 TaxID=2817722 RepID=UPI00285C7F78|nr:hypothetical protein [Rhizobium sp. BE258]MDR7145212.1 hypothetical protein [Rhizobium sp. BE258]
MTAANNPQANPAQSQAARTLARSILSSVAAASASNAQLNSAISGSFGISVTPNGGVAVTCKAVNGEVVATTAVSAAAAGSNAGVGGAVNSDAGGGATVGLNGPQARGGGAARHVSFAGSASPSTFTTTGDVITATIQVPSPEAGAGFISTIGLVAMLAARRLRRSKDVATPAAI